MSKILVIGGSGFLGSHVADDLSNRGHQVTIFDINKSEYLRNDQKLVLGTVLDTQVLENTIKGQDFVYHSYFIDYL